MSGSALATKVGPTIYGNFRFYPGTVCRVFLNDIPVFQGFQGDGFSNNQPVSHFLVPGVNELKVEVLWAPKPIGGRLEYQPDPRPQMAGRDLNQTVEVALFKAHETNDGEIEIIYRCMFPDLLKDVPEERRQRPYMHVVEFEPPATVVPLKFLSAQPQDVPCEGTKPLHDAVKELHQAFVDRDADKLAELMQLQMAEFAQSYPGDSSMSEGTQLSAIKELVREQIVVQDLDWSQMHFHARAGGRFVHVERLDRMPVFDIKTVGMGQGHASDPVFTHDEGRWRLM